MNIKELTGNPDKVKAVIAEQGPGIAATWIPNLIAALTMVYPGSEISGSSSVRDKSYVFAV
ncbi:MAG: hypothetical protein MRQ13_01150 [Candidatus Midichloria sp.]|nr:hypothetical protein [Candidatus Midichloria sp.]